MWRNKAFFTPTETRFLADWMQDIKGSVFLQKKANSVLDEFRTTPQILRMYECPQTPVYHAEGPFVEDHVRLILLSLFAILEGKLPLLGIEELRRLKGYEGEIEEMEEVIKEHAATFEAFALCHDIGKPLTISFDAQKGTDGASLGFSSVPEDLWHPGHPQDQQQMLLKKYQTIYAEFAKHCKEINSADCQEEFFSCYKINLNYHGHAHSIFQKDLQRVLKNVAKQKRLTERQTEDLFLMIDVHMKVIHAFKQGINPVGYAFLFEYAKKYGADVDDFLDKLQAAVLLDVVCGSVRRDAHTHWHETATIENFLRSEYASFPGKQEETLHMREQKEKEKWQKRFRDFRLDGVSLLELLQTKPGPEFGKQLKQIQEAALQKAPLPDLPQKVQKELERRIVIFSHTKFL